MSLARMLRKVTGGKRNFSDATNSERAGLRPAARSRDRYYGDAARDSSRWNDAERFYTRHLKMFPQDFAIWVQLGHMRKEQGNCDAAMAAYDTAQALDDLDPDLLLWRGHLLRQRGEWEAAAICYRRSFELNYGEAAAKELLSFEMRPFVAAAEIAVGSVARKLPAQPHEWDEVGVLDPMAEGSRVTGWAVDPCGDRPAEVVFFQEGREVGRAVAELFRAEAVVAGRSGVLTGFEADLDIDFTLSEHVAIVARLASTGRTLRGSPADARPPRLLADWLRRDMGLSGAERELVRSVSASLPGLRLSIVMPVYNTPQAWLHDAINSVLAQWSDAWELICVDDGSADSDVGDILAGYASADSRIRPVYRSTNGGIARATNNGIAIATGSHVAFMDHDDRLEPDAVSRILEAAAMEADLIYSDEAVTANGIASIQHIVARPAFSYDYYLSHPYFVHFVAVRSEIVRGIGGLDELMTISADVDFVLRVIENSKRIAHVPSVLYRWRTHSGSAGHAQMARVTEATVGALNRHLQRTGQRAQAHPGACFNSYRIDFIDDRGRTLIVIPTKDRRDLLERAVSSILATTKADDVDILVIDHDSRDADLLDYLASMAGRIAVMAYKGSFNFARMNNEAVRQASSDYRYVLFCNNDVEAIEPGWLEHMRGLSSREEVGVVGATLLYGEDRVQHAGVIVGMGGLADHANKFRPFRMMNGQRDPGYNSNLVATRDYSAVTAACMMIRRDTFDAVGGFDEAFEIGFNDTDLCLRIGALGLKVLNDAHAVLYHHESATRYNSPAMDHPEDARRFVERWRAALTAGDPFYNPLLDTTPGCDHRLRSLDNWLFPVRIVKRA